jgi:hypothetical protein
VAQPLSGFKDNLLDQMTKAITNLQKACVREILFKVGRIQSPLDSFHLQKMQLEEP